MPYERIFTGPQRKALLWLVPGMDCGDADRSVSSALSSLALYHKDLVRAEWKKTPRGRRFLSYRLTDLGVAVRSGRASNPTHRGAGEPE